MSLKSPVNSRYLRRRQAAAAAGFTYVELMVATAILALVAGTVVTAMGQANNYAFSHRVYTCAQTLAQNEIDAFLSAAPFHPQLNPPLVPPALVEGTTMNNNVQIYADPESGGSIVTGSMTRTVADLALTQTTNGVTQNLRTRRLTVTLNYTFGGKDHSVRMSTLRSSDS